MVRSLHLNAFVCLIEIRFVFVGFANSLLVVCETFSLHCALHVVFASLTYFVVLFVYFGCVFDCPLFAKLVIHARILFRCLVPLHRLCS